MLSNHYSLTVNGFVDLSQLNKSVLSTYYVQDRMTKAGTESKLSDNMAHTGTPLHPPRPLKPSGRCGWEDTTERT